MRTITILYLLLVTSIALNTCAHFITCKYYPGSRLGDHLLTYSHAKLIAHLSGLPIHCPPFEWSDQLALHTLETYTPGTNTKTVLLKQYPSRTLHINTAYKSSLLSNNISNGYVCTLKTIIQNIHGFNDLYLYTQKDTRFKSELKRMICPVIPLEQMPLPHDMITVAVHVRKGGGYDKPLSMDIHNNGNNQSLHTTQNLDFADRQYPRRFPPEAYYIEQIATVAHMYDNKPLFVHIFTDDQNPLAIIDRFKNQLSHLNITFSCRTTTNTHNTNVLDDLFNMMQFDVLIRPASSYSKMAQLLGDHAVIIYPKRVHWVNNILVADKVGIINSHAQL